MTVDEFFEKEQALKEMSISLNKVVREVEAKEKKVARVMNVMIILMCLGILVNLGFIYTLMTQLN